KKKTKNKKNYRHAVEELSARGPIQPASWWQKKTKMSWQSNMDVPRHSITRQAI
ncbi:hypothetical protein NC653_012564, partial [Populus alba x Populus x berolinensis]